MKTISIGVLLLLILVLTATAQRQKSDRDADGYKGAIKEVIIESKRLKAEQGKWIESDAKREEILNYDRQGNRVKQTLYDYRGNVDLIRTYSLIDGDKTSKDERVEHDYSPPIITVAPAREQEPRDNRFTYRFKYKYDAKGNRLEEAMYQNDGSLWLRYVSVYDKNGNEVEWFRYTSTGELNGRSITSFDSNDREIEKTWFNAFGVSDEKWSYSYEAFASHGNWIKRKSLKWVDHGEKSFFEPYEVVYRHITYF